MAKLTFDITMSLDGFVAGPNPSLEQPLGSGGERLHEWGSGEVEFEATGVVQSPAITHLRFRVVK